MPSDSRLPLQGIRVVDLCQVYAGPFTCSLLGMLGAEVIRVESRGRPEMRQTRQGTPNLGFHLYNSNKRSITLNLVHPDAVGLVKRLIVTSDVVAENFRPGVMTRFGLNYELLRVINPGIVMLSLSALGDSGPEREYGALALTFSGLAGLSHLTGYEKGIPTEYRGSSDFRNGFVGAFAILSALHFRHRTGIGQRIDLSARDSLTALLGDAMMDYSMNRRSKGPTGNSDELMAPHNAYRCAGDDHWVAIAISTDEEFQQLCLAIGQRELASDARFASRLDRRKNRAELDAIITQWTEERSDYEAMQVLQNAGVAAMPSLRADEVMTDSHLGARGLLEQVMDGRGNKVTLMNPPWEMSSFPSIGPKLGPEIGEANSYVFGEILGLSDSEIQTLVDELAIY